MQPGKYYRVKSHTQTKMALEVGYLNNCSFLLDQTHTVQLESTYSQTNHFFLDNKKHATKQCSLIHE